MTDEQRDQTRAEWVDEHFAMWLITRMCEQATRDLLTEPRHLVVGCGIAAGRHRARYKGDKDLTRWRDFRSAYRFFFGIHSWLPHFCAWTVVDLEILREGMRERLVAIHGVWEVGRIRTLILKMRVPPPRVVPSASAAGASTTPTAAGTGVSR